MFSRKGNNMEVTQIKHSPISSFDTEAIRTFEQLQGISDKDKVEQKVEPSSQSWKKKILLDALDVLENNIQPDNNHPLSREDYAPIESYEEALIELNFLKESDYAKEASPAQANINPGSVLELFADEKAFFQTV